MMFTKKKKLKTLVGCAVALTLSATMFTGTLSASAMITGNGGKYYADYATQADAKAAADLLNTEISGEGNVLLKNDGMLPLYGKEKISVFGVTQDSMQGGTGSDTVTAALRKEGFNVNPTLESYYASIGATIGTEKSGDDFSNSIKNSFDMYGDAAVIVLSRGGTEGADLKLVTNEYEDNKDGDGNDYGWEHEALLEDAEGANAGKQHKHNLQLTDSEEKMIAYVKANFKKIVVLLNTSNAMEMANLQDDDAINAILWIGRPGSTGINGMAKILSGEYNPSGKLVDEWYRDFSADPTWQNMSVNEQVGTTNLYDYDYTNITGAPKPGSGNGYVGGDGYYGIDYDEDIYLGYRYYETVYAELIKDQTVRYDATNKKLVQKSAVTGTYDAKAAADAWWSYAVVYPFGYGLSYTTFTQDLGNVYYIKDGKKVNLADSLDGSIFASSEGHPATVEKLYAPVTVENTGNVAGKQVVQIYMTMPYTAGGIEKAEVNLVGYAKSSVLRPGQSEVVTVAFNVQDFASFDYNDANGSNHRGYELDPGTYSIKVMEDSHRVADKQDFTITGTTPINLDLDDFSHNVVTPVFSNGDMYDTLRKNNATGDKSTYTFLNVNKTNAPQTLLTRATLYNATNLAITAAERALSDEFVKAIVYRTGYNLGDANSITKYADDLTENNYYYSADTQTHFGWYKTEAELKELMAGWTQSAEHASGYTDVTIKLADMAGKNINDEAWLEFMNQLTWAEIQKLINSAMRSTGAVDSIGKPSTSDPNGPLEFCGKYWCDEVVVASTWNVELGKQYGILNANLAMLKGDNTAGWYGPGMNTHRSPFGGRNNEYYSQDGIQGGYMAAAVVGGAQSRGLNVWAKHAFLNDQEENRSRQCLFTWVSEAAIRDIYAKPFQMAMQEGNATGTMIAYNRIGAVVACANYNYLTKLVREEWGWNGEFVTDYYGNNAIQENSMDLLVRVGGNLPDGTASAASDKLNGTWDKDAAGVGTTEKPSGNIYLGSGDNKVYSLTQWYYGRTAAQQVLCAAANTLNVRNGVNTSAYSTAATFELKQGTAASNVSVAMEGVTGANYAVTSGTLPAGLSLNASTGAITGTPTASGSTKITVSVTVDGWIKASKQVTLNVASAFTFDGLEAEYKVGDEIEIFIDSETVNANKYTSGITYKVNAGELPEGVSLVEDSIVGTPSKAGTYTATIEVKGSYRSGRNTVTDTYHVDVTIKVTGEATVEPVDTLEFRINEGVLQFSTDGENWINVATGTTEVSDGVGIAKIEKTGTEGLVDTYTITLTNGQTQTFTVTNGAKGDKGDTGAQGDKGDKGDTGAQGDKGDKGDTGAKGDKGDKGETGAQGPAGEQGPAGSGCSGNIGSTIGTVSAALVLAAAAAVVVRKKRQSK